MSKSVPLCTAFLIFSLLLLIPFRHAAAQNQPRPVNATDALKPVKIEQDFKITGNLDNKAWQQAPAVSIAYEVQPNDGNPAPVDTKVKVLYSEEYLYIGFIAHDPEPSKIRAHLADRDNSFQDDFVGIFLDPFNNNQHAYEFFINPLGIQMDGMRTGNNEDMNFDALWYSEGKKTDNGYKGVMKIPFQSLNFPDKPIQEWSVQFIRNYPRNSRYQFVWTEVDLDNSCLMCQNGLLTNIRGVESSNNVELIPYAMGYQSSSIRDADAPNSGLDHGPVDGRLGGSISYSPTSTASIDAVINPDFSQVETDAAQISANQTFALYYSEKRPFFMKGADLFNTHEDLYYSRMINHPLAAGKFTQKSKHFSLALLTAYDRDAPFIIPGLEGSSLIRSNLKSYSNVVRGKYNFGPESYVGGLLTTRNQQQAHNYVGSLDWSLLLTDHYYFNGQLAYADTKELSDTTLFSDTRRFGNSSYDAAFNGEQFAGTMLGAEVSREAKYYSFSVGYKSFSPTFQAQDGFINRTDRRQIDVGQEITFFPDKSWYTQGGLSFNSTWRYDFSGRFMERYIYAGFWNNLGGQTNISIGFLPLNDEQFRGRFFSQMHRLMINVDSDPLDVLSFGGHLEKGRYIYRTDSPSLGHGYSLSAYATLKPSPRLYLTMDYSYSTLSSLDDAENYYSGDIIRLNSRYNFSRRLFARFITQYNSFDQRLQVYPLLYYKLNPFTKFYVGMTDYLNHYDRPGEFQGYRQTDRQFFVKFQYLIRSH